MTTFKGYPCLGERQIAILGSTLYTSLLSVAQLRVSSGGFAIAAQVRKLFTFHVYFLSSGPDGLPVVSGALA